MLITIPLYVRLVLYPPGHYPMMPTDQRLLSRHVSSFWCQSQLTQMNGSFNTYIAPHTPTTSTNRSTHFVLHSTMLKDDVKEYWGFHLLKGSKVTISTCSSTDGGQLMILRGVENLRRCAWIGEKDSAEEVDSPNIKDDIRLQPRPDEHQNTLGEQQQPGQHQPVNDNVDVVSLVNSETQNNETHVPAHKDLSEERRQDLHHLLRQAVKMSKNKKEILQILHSVGRGGQQPLPKRIKQIMGYRSEEEEKITTTAKALPSPRNKRDKKTEGRAKVLLRETRSVNDVDGEEYDGAFEIFDDVEEENANTKTRNRDKEIQSPKQTKDSAETIVGGQIFFPEGLKFERGKFNQTTKNDGSNEEEASSYSSSEEALASCEGVIMALPLLAYRRCSYRWIETNKVVYDIPLTGTYYFVFSSDNEISTNHIYFNLTIERVVYDTEDSQKICTNTSECSAPLSFWSKEETLVEVPEEGSWDHSYVLNTKCEPRVAIYLTFLLLVPLMILFYAFH
ncbi:hypothetical protein Hamer_G006233 [Homarus americanus]|uniref:E3 ubiquitin-protein ligase APD1-4 middle domain-containing protein n=2 Tax=Homarus americanus TaxID=6706 RepID=A0A8J5JPU9_HOMAM|nr:hypothetical protein Hamer_G006233 [Homarus americanus]